MSDTPKKDCIVIAEDSPPNRKILSHLLEKLGFEVIACDDGQMAWDKIKDGALPHLAAIISDVMMPNMDGIQLLKQVRSNPKLEQLPFLLVTAVSDREQIDQARSYNVQGYILKPVTFQRVLGKLQELFPERKFPQAAA